MNISFRATACIFLLSVLLVACKKNQAPVCTFESPDSTVSITRGESLSISVTATDADGSISEIVLLMDNTEISRSRSDRLVFQLTTADLSPEQYSLKAIAYDNDLLPGEDIVLIDIIASVPVVTTTEVSITSYLEAESGGIVSDNGGAALIQRGICWSKTEYPTVEDNTVISGSETGQFTSKIEMFDIGETYFVRAFAENSSGMAYGQQVSFMVADPNEGWSPGDNWFDYRDSVSYRTVVIDSQVWMAENLKSTRLNDGTEIPNVTDNDTWAGLSTPAYRWALDDKARFGVLYGPLYNWYTVETGRLCPSGWHTATDAEWFHLENFVDPTIDDPDLSAYNSTRGTDAGIKLKATSGWGTDYNGTDDYGFSALPGGICYFSGGFGSINGIGFWWTSTSLNEDEAWYRAITNYSGGVTRRPLDRNAGFSVRCIKD